MRIVIDMQGAQTESRFRGIGRYTLSFVKAVARNRGEHEIFLALNGMFPQSIEAIREAFADLLPRENIRVWHAQGPASHRHPENEPRRKIAEIMREAFLQSLSPDIIHVCSLFEGFSDDGVTSIGRFDQITPVSLILYDLIPLLNPEHFFSKNPAYKVFYDNRLADLERATAFLSISEHSRLEGIKYLDVRAAQITTISAAIEPYFKPVEITRNVKNDLLNKFKLTRSFVLYTGGADDHKNLPRLIKAYARLPLELRQSHHLVFAGKMPMGNMEIFKKAAKSAGLGPDDLCFTGYISDEELRQLYNLCELYVFPSWYEGFGLPALEAMACGAPVLASNAASLPEVIGLEAALFDPFDVSSMSSKISKALEDSDFKKTLQTHGLKRAREFSWDKVATGAIAAWEAIPLGDKKTYSAQSQLEDRLYRALAPRATKLAATSRMSLAGNIALNQQAGVQRQLFIDISELSQRDAGTGVQRVVRSYLECLLQSPPKDFRVQPVYATLDHGYFYARAYTQQFLRDGNSGVCDTPVQWQRGDIFFALDMQHHVQLKHHAYYQKLRQDGVTVKFMVYDLLPIQLEGLFIDAEAKQLHEQWLGLVAESDGAICISQATADALRQWISKAGLVTSPHFQNLCVHIGADTDIKSRTSGVPETAPSILEKINKRPSFLSVSTLEPRKAQTQILDAIELLWKQHFDANLIFVGRRGWNTDVLVQRIKSHPEYGVRLFWLEGISDEYLEKVYEASACLIAASINEGFGLPLIEAAHHGTPVIARDIPVFHEVAGKAAYYFGGDTGADLAKAIQDWYALYQKKEQPKPDQMRWSTWAQSTEALKFALVGEAYPSKQLLLDISELSQRDAKSGIQRVVRNILVEWMKNPPAGYRVEPVYAGAEFGYRYARRFAARLMDWPVGGLVDDPIDHSPGDVFLGLDFQPILQVTHADYLRTMRRQGVFVSFVIYDLLIIQMPQFFVPGSAEQFLRWLEIVTEMDAALCISAAVADDLIQWIESLDNKKPRPFRIESFHLGADLIDTKTAPQSGKVSKETQETLEQISKHPSFLMVGTLEPRKGHEQVLSAFENLWRRGFEIRLVIVGKQGWMTEDLVKRLDSHSERGKHLFWLEGISDHDLEELYATCSCLIAASYGEGFGLPLIEAAKHKTPIIARDIPVFREIAEDYASYFKAQSAEELAASLEKWLNMYNENRHAKSEGMPWSTWAQSAKALRDRLLSETAGII